MGLLQWHGSTWLFLGRGSPMIENQRLTALTESEANLAARPPIRQIATSTRQSAGVNATGESPKSGEFGHGPSAQLFLWEIHKLRCYSLIEGVQVPLSAPHDLT